MSEEAINPIAAQPAEAQEAATDKVGSKALQQGEGSTTENTKSTFSSLSEMRTVAPEVYEQMMKGIAQSIMGQMRRHQERLKKLVREGQRRQ